MIPRLTAGSGGAPAPIAISDARGVPVFKAVFLNAPGRPSGRKKSDFKRLVLSSATGDAIFAFCRDTEVDPHTGHSGLAIFRHSEQLFGDLRADGPRPANGYSVSTHRGWRMRFRGDPDGRNLNATDENGRLLAITESHGPARRSVRIGPLVDAGLIAISVLGIDVLGMGYSESQRL
uniref:Tubby C-terminal domain-containing protein n=1 Tax=Alexandrium andersonii TaxID=327968 RepID=A0A7S2MD21_9DINO|mmetsp:Transcript_66039/g.148212  ORF Transcript_66039/g.148212 Transcript_66039/m.148212 type:complete len:177 (+) Transcript_66039:1-531(+)